MASKKLTVEVEFKGGDAEQGADKVAKKVEKIGKEAKQSESAFGSLGNAIKSLGVISLIAKAFDFFKETLMKNQKIADAFAIGMEFISRVLTDLVSFIMDSVPKAIEFFTDLFSNPKKYLDELAEGIKNNIMERIQSLIDAFGYLGDIIGDVFSGDFSKAAEDGKKFLKETADIVTGVNDSFDKTVAVVKEAGSAISDYAKKTLEAATQSVELKNAAKLAASEAALAAARFKKDAEIQRQIRDDQNKSIDDRIAANKKLSEILDNQLKAEKRAAELNVASARYEYNKNKNLENRVALNEALAELAGKEEEITGQRSEQLQNEVALQKEKSDIIKSQLENANKLVFDFKKANAELIKDDIEKLEKKKEILKEESDAELKRLQDNVNNTTANTAARAEAEIALANKKQEILINTANIEDQIAVSKYNKELARIETIQNNANLEIEIRKKAIEDEAALNDEALANKLISEKDYNDKNKALSDARKTIAEEEYNNKVQIAQAISQVSSGLSELIGKDTAVGKGLAIASATIDTYTSASTIFKQASKNPITIANPAFPYLMAAPAVLQGLARVKAIASVKVPNTSSSSSVPSVSSSAPMSPQMPQAQMTQLNQQSINDLGNQAIKAYVVETDMTTNQQRIKAIQQRARFG